MTLIFKVMGGHHTLILAACLTLAKAGSVCRTVKDCPSSCGQNNYCNECGVCLPCDSLCFPVKSHNCDAFCPDYSIHYMGAPPQSAAQEARVPQQNQMQPIQAVELVTMTKLPNTITGKPIVGGTYNEEWEENADRKEPTSTSSSINLNVLIISLLAVLIVSVWIFILVIVCKIIRRSKKSEKKRPAPDGQPSHEEKSRLTLGAKTGIESTDYCSV
ncbi:hypothetical protein CAPTEDRAFT_201834 [Capitella teleta]|uniref:TNFR-Cys domain-containing protein n=1 Tax=Capitella teleta TaxID=283909 RepID=R7UGV0_CAPTE|nr:hypothetical protein CAPTEDRAFT_201834 [Capitella teleta]|eukprot:ELU03013.1 hypothetical protein CAPTEDRAFT_201834 [Capitella teleta]